MTRWCAELNNGNSTYIFCGIIPLCNFPYRNRVRSITLIPFKIISWNSAQIQSMTRWHAEIHNIYSTYIFCGIIPLCNFPYRNCVHSITLVPFEIMSQNLVEIYSMTRRCAEINNGHSTYIFCGIIPLCNFQYRNRVRSITLIPFEIILQNLVEI